MGVGVHDVLLLTTGRGFGVGTKTRTRRFLRLLRQQPITQSRIKKNIAAAMMERSVVNFKAPTLKVLMSKPEEALSGFVEP